MGEMRREWIYKGSEKVRRGIGVLEGAVLKPLAAIKDCVLEGAVRRTFLCVRARYKKNCPSQDCDLFIPVEIKDRRRKKGCCYEGEFFKRRKKRRSLPRCASRLKKGDLLEVARELRVEVNGDLTKVEIKDMILQNDKNDMETIKVVMEGILEEKEREFEERRQTREYELERLRLSNATETVSVSSADLEGQGVNRRVNKRLSA
ncbi:uncharacterized protein TNCV_184261 [Trichonephila clavipes]|nr:uncharacterized protein TNCV_184261 [Trichonephila clavipes]